ncbi:Phospholemman [Myotis brandtii]|uniref:FXYD domain-containing ion transport regulator n=1 Tax=Myotis brandtii TaxID=109478 RepID=S7PC78_MYOBR|nr:Phospholemman [Myotis brandtii]
MASLDHILVLCVSLLAMARAEAPQEHDPFTYDYQSLRIGGLVIAGVLFILGILIVFSEYPHCLQPVPAPPHPAFNPALFPPSARPVPAPPRHCPILPHPHPILTPPACTPALGPAPAPPSLAPLEPERPSVPASSGLSALSSSRSLPTGRKCRCKFNQQQRTGEPDEEEGTFRSSIRHYDTVQTVGMTLATILFLLGILIIISKKVKCRKADSRSERSGSSGESGERGGNRRAQG